jgi:hypothetical protein
MYFNDRRVILTVTTAASLVVIGAIGSWSRSVHPAKGQAIPATIEASAQELGPVAAPVAASGSKPSPIDPRLTTPPAATPPAIAPGIAPPSALPAVRPESNWPTSPAPASHVSERAGEPERTAERSTTQEAEPLVEAPCIAAPSPPAGVVDTFNTRDAKGWWFGNNQQIPYVDCGSPVARSIGTGYDWAAAMSRPETFGPGTTFSVDFRVDNDDSQFHVGVTTPDYRNRLVLLAIDGRLAVQLQRNDVWTIATQFAFEPNAWYRASFRLGTSGAISVELENLTSHLTSAWSEAMPSGLSWRFLQGVLHGTALLDNFVERSRPIVPLVTRDLVIYGDSLSPLFRDVSLFARLARQRTIQKRVGANSLGVSFQQPTSRLSLAVASEPLRASSYMSLKFWIFATGGGAAVDISTQSDGVESTRVTVAVAPDQWTEVTVPLSLLGSPNSIERIVIANSAPIAPSPFFLDELRLSIAPAVALTPIIQEISAEATRVFVSV